MHKSKHKLRLKDFFVFLVVLGLTTVLCLILARVDNDNNPFAMAMYILAVALIARFTDGYLWGVLASLVGTFCVNYIFTIPFWTLNITYPGYPLTMTVMLGVSILISALTTQIKQQEHLRLEAEREKIHADLLRSVAHDLRTPLAAILGSASVLQTETLPEAEQKALADGICRDAEWLIRVTENLLTVTRVMKDSGTVRKQDEVLEEIIGSALADGGGSGDDGQFSFFLILIHILIRMPVRKARPIRIDPCRRVCPLSPAVPVFFPGLDLLPQIVPVGVFRHLHIPEDVRVPAYHLLGDGLYHVIQSEPSLALRDLAVHDDLQEHVAQLFAQILPVLAVDGLQDLVRLIDQAVLQGSVRLRAVPGTALVRIAEDVDDLAQLVHVVGRGLQICLSVALWNRSHDLIPCV